MRTKHKIFVAEDEINQLNSDGVVFMKRKPSTRSSNDVCESTWCTKSEGEDDNDDDDHDDDNDENDSDGEEELRTLAESHTTVLEHLETFRQLPLTMAEQQRQSQSCSHNHNHRFFLPYSVSPNFNPSLSLSLSSQPPHQYSHRRDFILPLLIFDNNHDESPKVADDNDNINASGTSTCNTHSHSHSHSRGGPIYTVIKNALNRNNQIIARILQRSMGHNAELCEVSVIITEPGAAAQAIHSDGEYIARDNGDGNDYDDDENNDDDDDENVNPYSSSPKIITLFIALHDILEEGLGGTKFVLKTHHPKCFPPRERGNNQQDGREEEVHGSSSSSSTRETGNGNRCWLRPTIELVRERGLTWFPMEAGDTAIMYSTCWHGGGANVDHTKGRKRCLLAVTFVEGPKDAMSNPVGTSRRRPVGRTKSPRKTATSSKKCFTLADFIDERLS